LREYFQNFFLKGFIGTEVHVLCVNFVKFGRPEVGKVVRYLPHQKKNFGSLSRARFCADRSSKCSLLLINAFTTGIVFDL